jgi:D-lactate dehydrogenase
VIRTGSRTTKGAVGYDLTRLLIGSEGTLALIVEATLKLTPLPAARRTLRASFRSVAAAAHAVAQVMAQPATPAALEFMDGRAVALVMARGVSLPAGTGALLLIEADGDPDAIAATVEAIARAATVEGLIALERAEDEAAIAALWSARKALSPALRDIAPIKINEDVVVPVSKLPALIDGLAALSAESGIPIVNFGHAGNGNLHVNLMVDPADPRKTAAAPETLARVFDLVIALGGTISGEHGIGLAKRDFMRRAIDPTTLALMRAIRRDFDPDGILNPGKLLPD